MLMYLHQSSLVGNIDKSDLERFIEKAKNTMGPSCTGILVLLFIE